jgi:NADPH:quinone reductase-like Zn-dependent oxidoreductase
MRAASLNYRDLLMVLGKYNPRQRLPLVPCSDGVGEVIEVGDGVERVAIGDRVCPIFAQGYLSGQPTKAKLRSTLGGPLDGTLAERMLVDAESVVRVPAHLTDEEAAALPCAAVTAWSALVTQGALQPGQVVLCLGTGGVSSFALAFAKLAGARVFVTSSSDQKLERARQLGADAVINYSKQPAWGDAARELTAGVGVDHVIEVGGGATLGQSIRAVRVGGTLSIIGMLSGVACDFNVVPVLMQNLRLQGVLVGHRDSFEAMNRAIEANALRPVIDRSFDFADVGAAFEYLKSGAHFGKVAIRIAK